MTGVGKRTERDCPIRHTSASSATKGELVDDEKGPKRPALEFEIRPFSQIGSLMSELVT
jgi:hypothetical protein